MQNELLLLTAPPASGKTYLLSQFMQEINQKALVIVPLRALANELIAKWGERCWVMTPEEWLVKKPRAEIIIFDEFHLFFYWGDTFRERMWECFYEATLQSRFCLLLTATMTHEMLEVFKTYHCQFSRIGWVDVGNQQLKNVPFRYYKYPSKKWLSDYFDQLHPGTGTGLIFCQYRHEVRAWEEKLKQKNYVCWSCVGGEAAEFSQLVRTGIVPDFIVATTVLSHGVNLPVISRIYFTYPVRNLDFWIQMVARGGRRGEAFDVFALENPHGLNWNGIKNYLAIRLLTMKMSVNNFILAIQEWFLKA